MIIIMNRSTHMKFALIALIFFYTSITFGQNWLWAKQNNGKGGVDCNWLCMDKNGNAYVTGIIMPCNPGDTMYFGQYAIITYDYDYLVKYDSNGNVSWVRTARGTPNDSSWDEIGGYSVTVDNFGNVYEIGVCADSTYFGSWLLSKGSFLVKYDSIGKVCWAKTVEGNPYAIAIDTKSNIYVTGSFVGNLTFGVSSITNNSNNPNMYLAKYDTSGNAKWGEAPSVSGIGMQSNNGNGIAVDKNGCIYIAGQFIDSAICFGKDTLRGREVQTNTFLAKYDSSGKPLWAKSPKCMGNNSAQSIVIDKSNNVCITGSFVIDSISFGNQTLSGSNFPTTFIVKYNDSGNVLWAKAIRSSRGYSYSITTNSCNDIFVGGGCGDTINAGALTYSVPSNSSDPAFFMRYDSNGNPLLGMVLPDGGDDYIGICVDKSGNCIMGGDFEDTIVLGNDTISPSCQEVSVVAKFDLGNKNCGNNNESIDELNSEFQKVIIYPNPNNGIFTIQAPLSASGSGIMTWQVYNILGQQVKSQELKAISDEINVSNEPSGLYLYRVVDDNRGLVGEGKFVIQK